METYHPELQLTGKWNLFLAYAMYDQRLDMVRFAIKRGATDVWAIFRHGHVHFLRYHFLSLYRLFSHVQAYEIRLVVSQANGHHQDDRKARFVRPLIWQEEMMVLLLVAQHRRSYGIGQLPASLYVELLRTFLRPELVYEEY
jgi:hypothetical protein